MQQVEVEATGGWRGGGRGDGDGATEKPVAFRYGERAGRHGVDRLLVGLDSL
ncbi:MAG: hypothetical protein KME20_27210 [Kaiparowitsia implicata GSE-PSE-MK54-09C]|jgi:hypothetical protein|nr:hypothetical protein [Kaiparowitsia implicata GSE-PSE-MK54-09C]